MVHVKPCSLTTDSQTPSLSTRDNALKCRTLSGVSAEVVFWCEVEGLELLAVEPVREAVEE